MDESAFPTPSGKESTICIFTLLRNSRDHGMQLLAMQVKFRGDIGQRGIAYKIEAFVLPEFCRWSPALPHACATQAIRFVHPMFVCLDFQVCSYSHKIFQALLSALHQMTYPSTQHELSKTFMILDLRSAASTNPTFMKDLRSQINVARLYQSVIQ